MSTGTRFVVFGEALTDFIREDEHCWRSVPGGACWNVARAAARLGVPTGYAGAVSCDHFGDELYSLTREAERHDAIRELRALAPRAALLLTEGAAGMCLLADGREAFHPAFPVEVVDTVGAGDASMGGWMASVLGAPDAPLEAHVAFASATAAVVCSHRGAYAPTRAEVEALLREDAS